MSAGPITDADFRPRRRWYDDPRPSVFVVLEVKTDGGNVRRNSIRSIAAIAANAFGEEIRGFSVNLTPPDGTSVDPGTLDRYRKRSGVWETITNDAQHPATGIQTFVNWVLGLPGQPIAVGAPLTPTALWLDSYLRRYTTYAFYRGHTADRALFAGGGIDLPSLVMGATGLDYREAVEHLLPMDWRGGLTETHRPLNDARMHAALFSTMLRMRPARPA